MIAAAKKTKRHLARIAGLYLVGLIAACLWTPQAHAADVRIRDIQGRAHESPLAGQLVQNVPGIVTGIRSHGFYMQDELPDDDETTSEGIFVYAPARVGLKVGDEVQVSGAVVEYRPELSVANALSSTNIRLSAVETLRRGAPLPAPIVLGPGGHHTLNGGLTGLDPALDVPAFYESLEGMRVRLSEARVVGPIASTGTMVAPEPLIAGARFSPRGALLIDESDTNPQRLMVIHPRGRLIQVGIGDRLEDATGILDHGPGYYALYLSEAPSWRVTKLQPESARVAAAQELSIAVYNVQNLDAGDAAQKFERIAVQIVGNLRSPDIIGLLEVQDDSGARDDGNTDASRTLSKLVESIQRLGGPRYVWTSPDPVDKADGGQPGGNIRQALLFDPQRVSLKAPSIRIGMHEEAFLQSRKPLVSVLDYRGQTLTLLLNHFISKRCDNSRCGMETGLLLSSEPRRVKQAQFVADYVRDLLARDAQASVMVMGDLNDFEFSASLRELEAAGLRNPVFRLPAEERYGYIHEGNAQLLDHMLLSQSLFSADFEYDIVHVNAEFAPALRPSDHDPVLLRLRLPQAQAQDSSLSR